MRVTGSRGYSVAAPVPKMPPGLVELMEGLTKDVLKHNPSNVYEFCANHLRSLLEMRDGASYSKVLTLEQKIKIAQKIVKQRAEKRWQKVSKELQINAEHDIDQPIHENSSIPDTTLKPVRHEWDLTNASEIEISCGPSDVSIVTGDGASEVKHVIGDNKENEIDGTIQNDEQYVEENEIDPKKQTDDVGEDFKETQLLSTDTINNEMGVLVEIKEENVSSLDESNNQPDQSDHNDIKTGNKTEITDLEGLQPDKRSNVGDALSNEDITMASGEASGALNLNDQMLNNSDNGKTEAVVPLTDVIEIHVLAPEEVVDKETEVITTTLNSDFKNDNQSAYEDINSGITVKVNETKLNLPDNASINISESNEIDTELEDKPVDLSFESAKEDETETNINIVDDPLDNLDHKNNANEGKLDGNKEEKVHIQSEEENLPVLTNKSETDFIDTSVIISAPDVNTDKPQDTDIDDSLQRVENDKFDDKNIALQENISDNNHIVDKNVLLQPNSESHSIDEGSIKSQYLEINFKDDPSSVYNKEEITDNKDNEIKNNNTGDDLTTNISNITPTNTLDLTNDHNQPEIALQEEVIEDHIRNKRNIETNMLALENNKDITPTADEVFVNIDRNADESLSTIEGVVKGHSNAMTLNDSATNTLDLTNGHNQPEIALQEEVIEDHIRNKRNIETNMLELENNQDITPTADEVFVNVDGNADEIISTIEGVVKGHSDAMTLNDSANTMDLETAAVTIQKVFRTFLFKSRASTFDDSTNDDNLPYEDNDEDKKDEELFSPSPNKDRRSLGISRMDTVLQTVNEEKSLSLSTDDSSTISSAATIIQAHVRGFLVRNKLNSAKTASSNNSLINSNGATISLEGDADQHKNKTVLNIHIVPEGNFLSRDESMITSIDLSLDGSPPSSVNLHPLGYDKTNERRKQLKREDAIQSISPPSNNSGKLSEDVESMKELPVNENDKTNASLDQDTATAILLNDSSQDTDAGSIETTPTNSVTIDTVIENHTGNPDIASSPEPSESYNKSRKSISKQSSDEMDVITPFKAISATKDTETNQKLLHSGEFHDTVLPTKVSRSDTSVVSGE